LHDDTLEYDDILTIDEIEKIKKIAAVTEYSDTSNEKDTRFILNPKRRELRKILKTRSMGDKYYKQREF